MDPPVLCFASVPNAAHDGRGLATADSSRFSALTDLYISCDCVLHQTWVSNRVSALGDLFCSFGAGFHCILHLSELPLDLPNPTRGAYTLGIVPSFRRSLPAAHVVASEATRSGTCTPGLLNHIAMFVVVTMASQQSCPT